MFGNPQDVGKTDEFDPFQKSQRQRLDGGQPALARSVQFALVKGEPSQAIDPDQAWSLTLSRTMRQFSTHFFRGGPLGDDIRFNPPSINWKRNRRQAQIGRHLAP